jgi:hypothetical protein
MSIHRFLELQNRLFRSPSAARSPRILPEMYRRMVSVFARRGTLPDTIRGIAYRA